MKRFTILLGLAVLFLTPVILADVPKLINFQGILRDGSGNPVADAVYTVRFRIYDDSTAGSTLWEETVPVPTISGLFNVRLGDATALPHNLFSAGVNRFVGIKVNLDPEMAPRTRLVSVPFAFHALRSDSAATATVALDLTCTGCVDATDLAANSVGTDEIATGVVGSDEIATDAVGADEIAAGAVGTSEIDATQVQRRVTGTAGANQYITAINQDGSVVIAADQVGAASGWTDDGAVVRLSTGTDNVGIGTTSTLFGARLEVVDRLNVIGTGTSRVFIAKDGDEYLDASYDAGFARGQITTGTSSQPLILQQIGGSVGIGTVGPGSRLQVEGQIASSVTGAAAPGFTFTGDLNTGLFETIPDEIGLATSGLDRLHITSGGNVGIGTTSPAKKLDVAGSVKADTVFSNFLSSNSPLSLQAPAGTTRMHIDDVTGNVGIGTTSPTATLHIFKSTFPSLTFDDAGATVWNFTHDGSNINMNEGGATRTRFLSGGDVHFGITGGNVGIGTSSPSTPLQVAGQVSVNGGTATAPAYTFASDLNMGIYRPTTDVIGFATNGTEAMRINSIGFLGIGTTTINAALDVERSGGDVVTFDRLLTDGSVVAIRQDGVTEGNISVSGTTVSYNAFTGSHYGWAEEALERGELVALTGVNRNSHDNPKAEIIYGIKRSNIPNDPACLGSYLALAEPSKTASSENPHLVMAVGNGDMWVVDEGQNIQPGDYLISSSTPGHAMKDDEGKYPIGHIVARAAEGVDWATLSEMTGGRKHKKISVLFGNFVRSNPSTVAQSLEGLQEIILKQQKEIEELKNVVLKDGSSVMAETKR